MSRLTTLILLLVMATAAVGLYQIKHEASEVAASNAALEAEIARAENDISVLKAEWSHLNDPARIQDLARRHLGLEKLAITQIARTSDIPMRPVPPTPLNKAQLDMLIEDAITATGSVTPRRQ
ncbi:MAG: cell division protein FtsL [Flavobacteriaceae bacterium]